MCKLPALLRREITTLDPAIPLLKVDTLERNVDQAILVERLVAALSTFFAIAALFLTAIGLYGVTAYTVTRRTPEIGVRIAVGAPRSFILWLIFRDTLSMILAGAMIGVAATLAMTRLVGALLYKVGMWDPRSLAFAAAVLAGVVTVATLLPARAATKVDPLTALRCE